MAKTKGIFSCQTCGFQTAKWLGRCPDCGDWNSIAQETPTISLNRLIDNIPSSSSNKISPQFLKDITLQEDYRLLTDLAEFDRVIGGGIVPGAVILLGGDPGIGKSTILLQVSDNISKKGCKVLYVSGEESLKQIKMRTMRLGITSDNLVVYSENCLENALMQIANIKPDLVIFDSIQTIYSSRIGTIQGGIGQVKELCSEVVSMAKRDNIAFFLVGHVTKEGQFAGPKMIEHMVDTVIYFEGEKGNPFRLLRTIKNRFGPTNEIGVFEMDVYGLKEVLNPSELFLNERPSDISGSVVVASMEGTRPILVELQVLVSNCGHSLPRRTTKGIDPNRILLLVAVLEKRCGLILQRDDIFVNVAGGVKLDEPAVDLGITAAIISSQRNVTIESGNIFIGEVGLGGEVRKVSYVEDRLIETQKLGFSRAFVPFGALKNNKALLDKIEIIQVKNVSDLITYI